MKFSLITITLGHGTALISVATTEIFAGLQKLERAQEEASLDLGANQWRTFWLVTLPNLRVSLIAAGLLIFTLSLDEIAVSFFLIGRDNTLPLEIWSRLRRGITPEINAISTLILLFQSRRFYVVSPEDSIAKRAGVRRAIDSRINRRRDTHDRNAQGFSEICRRRVGGRGMPCRSFAAACGEPGPSRKSTATISKFATKCVTASSSLGRRYRNAS